MEGHSLGKEERLRRKWSILAIIFCFSFAHGEAMPEAELPYPKTMQQLEASKIKAELATLLQYQPDPSTTMPIQNKAVNLQAAYADAVRNHPALAKASALIQQNFMLHLARVFFKTLQANDILQYAIQQYHFAAETYNTTLAQFNKRQASIISVEVARGFFENAKSQLMTAKINRYRTIQKLSGITHYRYNHFMHLKTPVPRVKLNPESVTNWVARAQIYNTIATTRIAFENTLEGLPRLLMSLHSMEAYQAGVKYGYPSYRAGKLSLFDLLQTEQHLFAAQKRYAIHLYSYLLNSLRLKQVTGTLSSASLQELDYLLVL